MTHLVRWEPFAEFGSLRRAMDRLFEDYAPASTARAEAAELTFPVDVSETGGEVIVKAVLPGIKPEDVQLTVNEGVLTLRGESRSETSEEKENFYRREIRYGSFARSLPLPARVDQEKAEAEFKDGVLTVHLPRAQDALPKSIKIKGAVTEGELAAGAPHRN